MWPGIDSELDYRRYALDAADGETADPTALANNLAQAMLGYVFTRRDGEG